MDWSNESYVRLYTRDTTTWKRLGWDGQAVLMQLLRKVDRAGTLDLSELEPWEAVALQTGASEEVARRGLDALVRTRTVVVSGGRLIFTNFLAAQEACKSDRLRQKESRERRAVPVTFRDGDITARDDASQNATDSSRPVTPQSDASRPVTNGHSSLSSAELNSAFPSLREGGGASRPAHGGMGPCSCLPNPPPPPAPLKARDEARLLWTATLRGEATARGIPVPEIGCRVRDTVLRLAREQADLTGQSFAETLRVRIAGGLDEHTVSGKPARFALVDWTAHAPNAAGKRGNGRLSMAQGTTHADFADADPMEVQLARLRSD